jgi:hypothetical protein
MPKPKLEPKHKVIYLPPIYDSKKFQEGILELLNFTKTVDGEKKGENLE